MNRRQFLIRSSAAVGALVTPQFLQQAQWLITEQDKPLLITPQGQILSTLYVAQSEGKYALFLDGLPNEYDGPSFTWEDFANQAWGYDRAQTIDFLREQEDITKREAIDRLTSRADEYQVFEWWARHASPNALAYHYLDALDLGPEFGRGRGAGDVRLIDGFHPGNDTLWAEVPDLLSISLLQGRLNELGEGTRLQLLEGDYGLG